MLNQVSMRVVENKHCNLTNNGIDDRRKSRANAICASDILRDDESCQGTDIIKRSLLQFGGPLLMCKRIYLFKF